MTGDQVVGSNSGELWVNLYPAAPYAATVAAVNEAIDGYPGLFRTVQTFQPVGIGDASRSMRLNQVDDDDYREAVAGSRRKVRDAGRLGVRGAEFVARAIGPGD